MANVIVERRIAPYTVHAAVRDFCSSGVQLLADAALRPGERVTLKLNVGSPLRTLCVPGEVHWVRATDREHWRVVCTFLTPLSEGDLDELRVLQAMQPQRKQPADRPLPLRATAQWELEPAGIPVNIQSFSPEGFCFVCAEPAQGERLRVQLGGLEKHCFQGSVKWAIPREHDHLVGCSFESARGYEVLWDWLHPEEPQRSEVRPKARSLSLFSQVAIVMVLCQLVAMR